MKANLAQNEPASMKRWDKLGLYEKAVAAREGGEPFTFHDGPPYANGAIHVGHLLNKVLKDIVVRTRLMSGRHCPYIPGWDCHGLPIEHKVVTELHEAGKLEKINALDEDKRRMIIRKECQKSAEKFVKLQAGQMQRLLTLADYADPYLTMKPRYEREVITVFARLLEEGLVYRDLKPVHWSIANQTALAEAELEYKDKKDWNIFVHFDALDPAAVLSAFGEKAGKKTGPVSFMIWTTTPWTLPANLAVAVHPRFRYGLVRLENGRLTVLAKELIGKVAEAGGKAAPEVIAETGGEDLLGLEYQHPFIDRAGKVVGADYVKATDGTGLVHTAPGHGAEDYQTGLREGLDVYCPVKGDGTFDDSAPDWLRGVLVWKANPLVIDRLRESGHLFAASEFDHSYPHDWRSKTPVIFRATEQWFIGVERPVKSIGKTLRELALDATENEVEFFPGWGRNRLRGMLTDRPDWCISRQRSWGLPIPAFRNESDGGAFMTPASVRAVAEAFGQRGSDAWFTESPTELLADYDPASDPEAPEGLDISKLTKNYDIFDVWFESGTSWQACMRRRGFETPVDLYLEGSDQHRGWFQLSLLPALGATGQPPFKALLTHGFMVDKDGKKMSKSQGNALNVEDLLQNYGADICRWWTSSLAYDGDIKVDLSFFNDAADSYRKIRNTLRFLLSNLSDFDPGKDAVDLKKLSPASLDAYALHLSGQAERKVRLAYEKYNFREAHLTLFDLASETLSAFYLGALKDRLYCDKADSDRRRTAQTVIYHLAESLIKLLAPIIPHTADEAWRELTGDANACVHLENFAEVPEIKEIDESAWEHLMAARDEALRLLEEAKAKGIENRLDAAVRFPDPKGVLAVFDPVDVADMLGVSQVKISRRAKHYKVDDLRTEETPRCERSWKRDGTVKKRRDGSWLSDRDAAAVGMG